MNQSNLKNVLRVAVNAICAKARGESMAFDTAWQAAHNRINAEVATERAKAVDKAYATIKAAPLVKTISITWRDEPHRNGGYHLYTTTLTPWAEQLMGMARTAGQDRLDKLNAGNATVSLLFSYGSSDKDSALVRVPAAREAAYRKLREEFDNLYLAMLLADAGTLAGAMKAFLAKVAAL